MQNLLMIFGISLTSFSLWASPFTTAKDSTKYDFNFVMTTADGLMTGDTKVDWDDMGFKIKHEAYTLGVSRGISDSTDIFMALTYKRIENEGLFPMGGVVEDDSFSGWSDAEFGIKHMHNYAPFYVAGIAKFSAPASDYNQHKLITPGNGASEFFLGANAAYYEANIGFMAGLNYGRGFRLGTRVPDQDKYSLTFYYTGIEMMSVGAFYGGVQSVDGIDIGDDEFAAEATAGNGGHIGPPFDRIKEVYNYAGLSLTSSFTDTLSLTLSYMKKLESGAQNTDLSNTITLSLSQVCTCNNK